VKIFQEFTEMFTYQLRMFNDNIAHGPGRALRHSIFTMQEEIE